VWEAVKQIVAGVGSLYDPAAVRGFLHVMGATPRARRSSSRTGARDRRRPGAEELALPRGGVLRDAQGNEAGPVIVATDLVAPPGESAVAGFST